MKNYSIHKITVIIIALLWTFSQFQSRNTEELNYDDGVAKRTGDLKNGLNHGTWTWYFPNGKVQLKGDFEEGNREGVWRTYDSLGVLRSESFYVQNKLNGKMILFSAEGDTISVKEFKEDKLMK